MAFNLGGAQYEEMSHIVFLGTRCMTVTPGPRKAPSVKAWLPLSLSLCLTSKVSHPLIPQLGSQQTTPGKEAVCGNSINLMMDITACVATHREAFSCVKIATRRMLVQGLKAFQKVQDKDSTKIMSGKSQNENIFNSPNNRVVGTFNLTESLNQGRFLSPPTDL